MIEQLANMINSSNNIVFFGGAGVSTESGIPDFRSTDGLYNLKYKYPPETILSSNFYKSYTKEFYEFYKDKMICLDAEPNFAHKYLYELEKMGKLKAVVTQNIDGLHQKAGSSNVLELHGSIHRNYCTKCKQFYNIDKIVQSDIPTCSCGGVIKPDVVLYGEGLDASVIQEAIYKISDADMLIIGGTSLAVYPASSFVSYYKGSKLVVINKTVLDIGADLTIQGSIAKTFEECSIR